MERLFGGSALLKAYITRLGTHASTSTYTVYNYTPTTATLPYIVVGSISGTRSMPLGCDDIAGEENTVLVDVWSEYKGDKEVMDMMNNIIKAVTSSALAITNYTDVLPLMEFSEVIIDDTEPAHLVRHGIIRFTHHMA